MSDERGLRLRIVQAARRLSELGLNSGRSGNLSARVDGGFIVTPSGAAYDTLHPDDLVYLTSSGDYGGGQGKPSSEWRIHRDIYAHRPDALAVVHTHSPFATTLACVGRKIPPFHYEVAFAGGPDIRCAPYATFGTQELADSVVTALEDKGAALMANHGAVTHAATLDKALELMDVLEWACDVYGRAFAQGAPRILSEAQQLAVIEAAIARSYGTPQEKKQ